MADTTYVSEYPALTRHRNDMASATRQRRLRLAITGTVVAVAVAFGFWVMAPLGIMLAGIGAMALFFAAITGGSSVPADVLTGVEGEVRALKELETLPDDYQLFNQVRVPDNWLPNGERELDFIVVGPGGVVVVEVKNTPGRVYVDPDKRQWQVATRAGCGSRPGWHPMDSPVKQLRAQIEALERWLLSHGINTRVGGLVCFARTEVALENADKSDIPVVVAHELAERVAGLSPAGRLDGQQRQAAVKLLGGVGRRSLPGRAA